MKSTRQDHERVCASNHTGLLEPNRKHSLTLNEFFVNDKRGELFELLQLQFPATWSERLDAARSAVDGKEKGVP